MRTLACASARTKALGSMGSRARIEASRKAIFTVYGVGVRSVLPTVDVAQEALSEKSVAGAYTKTHQSASPASSDRAPRGFAGGSSRRVATDSKWRHLPHVGFRLLGASSRTREPGSSPRKGGLACRRSSLLEGGSCWPGG